MGMFSGGAGSKIDADVDFPLDGLDMSQYVSHSPNGESLIYDCYAVSNHYGNMGFGHYTAYSKNPLDGLWYEFDDSRVSLINK
jgi:ubiquitin C-terminal hydrolase